MILEQELGIVAMEPMGEYDATIQYEKLNIVTYNGSTYCALGDTLGNEPTNEKYWQLIAKKGDNGDTYVLTDEDKENIKNDITENANSDFNKNVQEQTTTFDNHITEKTTSFDTNAVNKTNEFNTNATTKLEEYNTNATSKFDSYNSNATNRLDEYNANADSLMTIATDTRNELERVKNDILETGEVSGDYIHLQDSTMAELQELEVSSNEKQYTTTGKNKLPYPYFDATKTINGVTFSDNGDGTVTVNGTAVENASFALMGNGENQQKILEKFLSGGINSSIIVRAVSYQDGTYHVLGVDKGNGIELDLSTYDEGYIEIVVYAGYTANNVVIKPMLSENGGEWEPYTGGSVSPNPDYPQEIPVLITESKLKSIGKNLFNKDNVNILNAFIDSTNNKITKDTNCRSVYIKCKPNTNYVISKIATTRFIVGATSITPNIDVVCNHIIRNDSATNISFRTDINDKYLIVYLMNAYIEEDFISCLNTLQIEEGSTATEYEECLESILNLPIPEDEFVGYINDDVKDQFRVGFNEEDGAYHLYLDKMLAKVVCDGSETWEYDANYSYFRCPSYSFALTPHDTSNSQICSHFPISILWADFRDAKTLNSLYVLRNNGYKICMRNVSITTVDEFKTWLSTSNVEVVYQLANPYTLDLGIVDMPLSYDGVTNIFVVNDFLMNINAKYYRNFTETVRNLQINNDTLKNELASIESRLTALETAQASASVVTESEVEE